ncbi:Na/Pi cotransporter family protein [Marinigracilibium pacificum]|uniref:Na/Pi cotransporter family protein n=1 Tax=Marinigracilibium pacificum TaxID=2729599 RepID=A0A848J1E6_9BACT|nr:Na/Pi cotransporter family protein [Marinigracilibium pacificum]NMM47052.1 Na/Pi cotransporter family protein [Marinigracilibium pacificum]
MQLGILDLLAILGSLGIFIYGMKVMSEGIQNLAGDKLKNILGYMTSNRFGGVATGFVTTSLIQSSSATTVMIVSFVNAGLLNLRQAIGVIMGANIGTTMTAVLITVFGFSKFSVSDYTLVVIALSLPLMFSKKSNLKSLGEFLFGFGLLFMGLDMLKDNVPDLKSNPDALAWIQNISDMGYASVIIFVFIGTLITVIVQSSSAAMAITLIMCDQGWIAFDVAAALVLGENIGTTITANLAAMVGNSYAKRAARAHFIFNVFGVIWMLALYHPFLNLIDYIVVNYIKLPSPFVDAKSVKWALTIFHISFNVINTFLLVWFVPLIEKTVIKMVPIKEDSESEQFKLEYIGTDIMRTPELSLIEVSKELSNFGALTKKMFNKLKDQRHSTRSADYEGAFNKIQKYEEMTDNFEEEITAYLVKLSEGRLNVDTSAKVVIMHSVTNDLERIGDSILDISKNINRLYKKKLKLDNKQNKRLDELSVLVEEAFDIMLDNLEKGTFSIDLNEARKKEQEINKLRKRLRKAQMRVIEDPNYEVKAGILFRDIYQGLEHMADQIFSVNLALAGEKFDLDEILEEDI